MELPRMSWDPWRGGRLERLLLKTFSERIYGNFSKPCHIVSCLSDRALIPFCLFWSFFLLLPSFFDSTFHFCFYLFGGGWFHWVGVFSFFSFQRIV
ncbi:hypothetical protein B9Z19DRAFT_611588 [Tuber borchii]|uniref:Uncharacterized protein n=1 Tax=Tuber borchii TaxID=42251 RepID=A0A2T7A126_TUBBO|nr:hypothetical protein B9Z19DRAFT_611588 [Tuber borchii]